MKGIDNIIKKNLDWFVVFLIGLIPIIANLVLRGLLFWNQALGCLNMLANITTLYTSLFLVYVFQFEVDRLPYPYDDILLYVLNFAVLFIGYYLLKKIYLKLPKYRKLMIFTGIIVLIFAIAWPLSFCLTFSFG
ncbi:hypothetical protein HYW19_00465 [Candidatus Woesearchaeota archaeon]|nr:hypothetical protein [Candidatus Woesearchaeota archaeon]